MKSFGVCVGLVIGLTSLPALAASVFDIAQATPAAPPAAAPSTAAPPAAATAPARPKMKAAANAKATRGKKVPSIITVENKRAVTLKGLQISLPGGGGEGKVIGKLAKEIVAGKTARVGLKGAKGCEYDVKWEFEDATDESTADLCNDPRIVLTD